MASQNAIRAGRAFVELFVDDSRLVRGLRGASQRVQAFGQSIRNIGLRMMAAAGAILAPMVGAIKLFARTGESIYQMSIRTGIGIEALSALGFAAEQSGADMETLQTGIFQMQKTIFNAGRGVGKAVAAFKELGVNLDDLKNQSPDQQFKTIADAIKNVENPVDRAALAMAVFGRGAKELLPLLLVGKSGIEALETEARRLGLVMSKEDAVAAHLFSDALNKLWKILKMTVFQIGAALAPSLKWISRFAKNLRDWVAANKATVRSIALVVLAVFTLGAALVALGMVIIGLGKILTMAAAVVSGVMLVFKAFGVLLAWLATPIGYVIGILTILIAGFLIASNSIGGILKWLGGKFKGLTDDAQAAWQGIADALAAGDIALAAKILWLTLKMWWKKGTGWLLEEWAIWKAAFLETGLKAWYGLLAMLTVAWGNLERAWVHTVSFLSKIWLNFIAGMKSAWSVSQTWLAKRFAELQGMLDSSLDVDAVKRGLDERMKNELAEIGGDLIDKEAEIEKNKRDRLNKSRQDEKDTLAELGKEYEDSEKRRKDNLQNDVRKAEDELAAARKEWLDALEEARRKRKQADADDAEFGPETPEMPGIPGFDPDELQQKFDEATSAVSGTFSGVSAGLLSAGPANRTAIAAEETARNTKKILDEIKNNGNQF